MVGEPPSSPELSSEEEEPAQEEAPTEKEEVMAVDVAATAGGPDGLSSMAKADEQVRLALLEEHQMAMMQLEVERGISLSSRRSLMLARSSLT